jgi:hypothetical protein
MLSAPSHGFKLRGSRVKKWRVPASRGAKWWAAVCRRIWPRRAIGERSFQKLIADGRCTSNGCRERNRRRWPYRMKWMLNPQSANAGDIHAHIELGIESAAKNQLDEALQHFVFAEQNSSIESNNARHIKAEIDEEKSSTKRPQLSLDRNELAESSWLQARRYHRGEGTPINYVEAIRLYRKAADLGHLQAKKMLDLIFSQSAETGVINIFWMQRLSHMDVSGFAPQLPTVYGPVLLAREETGLTDFIPLIWTNVYRVNNQNLVPCQPQIAPC